MVNLLCKCLITRFGTTFSNGLFYKTCAQGNSLNLSKTKNDGLIIGRYLYNVSKFSTLVNLNHSKIDKFLNGLNKTNIRSKLNLNADSETYSLLEEKNRLENNIEELKSMRSQEGNTTDGKEMIKLIDEDILQYTAKLTDLCDKLIECLIPPEDFENCNDVVLEISSGVGGSESMLFASELFNMYCGYLEYKGWQYLIAEHFKSDLGGVRQCSLLISGPGAYVTLRHEAGVHRVQRVPATEKGGRMHTSTTTVAVLPQPTDVEVVLKESDLVIETKRASGAGGQHVNTTDSAVRITHIPTGIVVECQTDRHQHQNKVTALKRIQSKIFERELSEQNSNIRNQRKLQVGTSGRSEKIRTYNYRDDRISDHRLSENIHNLKHFMEGGEPLDRLIDQLELRHYQLRIQHFVDSLPP